MLRRCGSTGSQATSWATACATHRLDHGRELIDVRNHLGQTSIRPVEVNARCSTRRQRDKFARLRKSDGLAGV